MLYIQLGDFLHADRVTTLQVQLLLPKEQAETLKSAVNSCNMAFYEVEAPLAFILEPDFLKECVTKREWGYRIISDHEIQTELS